MKQINIKRTGGNVTFETVSIDVTENVFFTNLDAQAAHWPTLAANQLGPAPSPNSSQCIVPTPSNLEPPNNVVSYGCRIKGHENEKGIINVFAQLAAVDDTTLANATNGQPIAKQQVVVGGKSPYAITGQLFQITDANGNVIKSGAGIGPNLQLNATADSSGIWVTGIPTLSGTYNFTFTVNDAMGKNLQQVQYSMKVA